MAKAAAKLSTQYESDPDAGLLAMITRHDFLWAEWDRVARVNDHDPRVVAIGEECSKLEPRIVATRAFTAAGLSGKRRVVERAELEDDFGIIETIFDLDEERIAATA